MSASSKRSQKRAAPQIDRSDIKRVRDADDDEEKDEEFGDMGDAEDFGEEEINQVADSTSLSIQDLVSFSKEWQRAECPPQDTNEDFIFQQIEIDVCSGKPHSTMAKGTDPNEAPHIRLFGVTKEGYSVMTRVHGFMPYFYADCPPISIAKQVAACGSFQQDLDALLKKESTARNLSACVLSVRIEERQSIYHFSRSKRPFFRVTVASPRLVPTARRILEQGDFKFGEYPCRQYSTYESNIEFVVRFMVDTGVVGCGWVRLNGGKYEVRTGGKEKFSRCQVELNVAHHDLVALPPEGEWQAIAPLRILSFDIECANRKGIFPEAEKDRIIQIANVMQVQGQPGHLFKVIFTLKDTAPVPGAELRCYEDECEMLMDWSSLIRTMDPDILTGYNIINFDLPYLLNRAAALKLMRFPFMGRTHERTTLSNATFQSKAYGKRENKSIKMHGRVQFDVLQVLFRDQKLRSYSLNSVSYLFLGQQKEDVHHSKITELQEGDRLTRRRLALYCLKDAILPLRLLDKLMCLINYIEMARVTGVPISYLSTRGQQIKVISQLLRKAKEQGLLMPARKFQGEEEYAGATVIEPRRGFYKDPVSVLDFSSLYPSIMMAHNLCYTSLVDISDKNQFTPEEITRTPAGNYFVKAEVRKGLLPEILEELLKARKKAKADLRMETDPFKKKVLDGRQLALKISANSVYGFTGATIGKLPCIEISGSVTAYGREMIGQVKGYVEEKFTKKNGYPYDAEVIYGDTDSVMVLFHVSTVKESIDMGKEAAEFVSEKFPKPIKLEFEKVYYPYLLINKKRYAGLFYTQPDKHDKMDCKGIETVRRDNCTLVANLINSCLQKILIERNPSSAIDYVKQTISDLMCNRIDISQLVITKELTRNDKDYSARLAHVVLASRMKERDAGSAPSLGDRVPYVIIAGGKGQAAYEKAEDPIYVLDNNIPIDVKYYLEQQLSKPLLRIFEPIMGTKAERELFHGDHTLSRIIVSSKAGGLTMFAKRSETCIGCKVVLKGKEAVCPHCEPRISELYQREAGHLRGLEERFSRLWTQCQTCQESLHEEIICTNRDCPIFYMRTKVIKDLEEKTRVISRFEGQVDW